MADLKLRYTNKGIDISVTDDVGPVPKDHWLGHGIDHTIHNLVGDLVVNEIAEPNGDRYFVPYGHLSSADRRDLDDLGIASLYPYDIYVSFLGPSFLGQGTIFEYAFQDYAGKNGTGNILASAQKLRGAYLDALGGYLLSPAQLALVDYINTINAQPASSRTERLERAAKLHHFSANAGAVLSRSMRDRLVEVVDHVAVDIEQVGTNEFRLLPKIEGEHGDDFTDAFGGSKKAKSSYVKRKDGVTTEFAVTGSTAEGVRLTDELGKLTKIYTQEEINEIVRAPSAHFDTNLLDLDLFGKRVIELGLYRPRFYPFISPYESQWVPGIFVEDPVGGTRKIKIQDAEVLAEFGDAIGSARISGEAEVSFRSERIPLQQAEELFALAQEQLKDTSEPLRNEEEDLGQEKDGEKKVLIIKENIEALDYSYSGNGNLIQYGPLERISGLRHGIVLKSHQQEGIQWLQNMMRHEGSIPGVLLADDMGLGKTLQVLYLIEWYATFRRKPILIVAPVSLLENWEAEYLKFFPKSQFGIHRVWGSEAKQFIVPNQLRTSKQLLSRSGIYLTTYETMRHKQLYLAAVDWGLVIMDEVQKIKTPGTMVTNSAKALKADFRIAMTGTPVENSLMDLWCIMDFCFPGLLGDAKSFSKKYIDPQSSKDSDKTKIGEKLRDAIGNLLIRRLKVDVAKDLPSITYHVRETEMPPEQLQRYVNVLNKNIKQREEGKGKQGGFELLFAIKQISDHPYSKIMDLQRMPLDRLMRTSAKLKTTVEILQQVRLVSEKVIIFTENREMQRVLRRVVSELFDYDAAIVNGTTPSSTTTNSHKLSRQDHIDAYQAKPGFGVIVMSPIAAGFGLNVTGANHVIHYTRHWNPAKEQQATDRAYRIGQDKDVHVYYPLAVAPKDTFKSFDLVLDELLSRKRELADSTLFPSEQVAVKQDDMIQDVTNVTLELQDDSTISSIKELIELTPAFQIAAIACLVERSVGGYVEICKSKKYGCDFIWSLENTTLLCQVRRPGDPDRPVSRSRFMEGGGKDLNTVCFLLGSTQEETISFDRVYKDSDVSHMFGRVTIPLSDVEERV